jgi:hypothetical protein
LSTINISYNELKDVQTFCRLNNIEDVSLFMKECFKKGFNTEKYGLLDTTKPEVIEKEVEKIVFKEVERIVEVPVIEYVEVEKEVEKIVEVVREIPTAPTEVEVIRYVDREIVKEVPVERVVEREVYITDDEEVRQLGGKITKLEEDKKRMEEDNQKEVIRYDTQISEYIRKISELESKPPTVSKKTTVDDSKQKALEETLRKLRIQMSEKDKRLRNLKKQLKIFNLLEVKERHI